MFPFCSCVCQDYNNWIIICNDTSDVLSSSDPHSSTRETLGLSEYSTRISFCKSGNKKGNSSSPDATIRSLAQPSTNADISYSDSYLTSVSPIINNYDYSTIYKDIRTFRLSADDSQLIEQASVTHGRRKLVKTQKNKKYNRRRQSINYFQRVRICNSDKYGLVDLTNYNLGQEYADKFLDNWNFNVFRMNRFTGGSHTLTDVGLKIFENQSLIRSFCLNIESLKMFLHSVEEIYHCFNPYHNSVHATDVAQAMHCFLLDPKIKIISEPIDVLSAIIAAFCHDADHPGLNQIHLEKINHFFVALYNHNSVLENHHFRLTMSLLQQSSLLNVLSTKEWRKLTSNIYNMIMATDITHQKTYLNKFMNLLHDKKTNLSPNFSKEDKTLIYQLAMKCADISNPCRCWPVTLGWASLVCEEFFLQGDMEKTQGLSVMPTHDRCMTTKADIQLGFIRFIVRPLVTQWNAFLKSHLSGLLIKYVDINLNQWELYKQRFSAVSAKVVNNPSAKIDLSVVNCSTISSTTPMPGLATLTEETTLASACSTKACPDVHRRLSLPDNVFNSLSKPQQPRQRQSTTMITFARPSPGQIPSYRRGSLPQHSRASSVSNSGRRRGSLPLMVQAFPIPSAWEEANNTKKSSSGPRTSLNPSAYIQRRRGSAPLIGCLRSNQDWKGSGLNVLSSCLKEQLLLEVYWMTVSSSVSSTNSVNAGSNSNIPPLYLSSSSGSSRNDSATGTITIR